jgi:hypothetical protein
MRPHGPHHVHQEQRQGRHHNAVPAGNAEIGGKCDTMSTTLRKTVEQVEHIVWNRIALAVDRPSCRILMSSYAIDVTLASEILDLSPLRAVRDGVRDEIIMPCRHGAPQQPSAKP